MTKKFSLLALAVALPLLTPTSAQACWGAVCPTYGPTGAIEAASSTELPVWGAGPWLPGVIPPIETPAAGTPDDTGFPFQTGAIFVSQGDWRQAVMGPVACRIFPREGN